MTNYINPYIDRAPQPEWGRDAIGRMVKLEGEDAVYDAAFVAWQSEACDHSDTAVFMQVNSIGRAMYFRWCERCGHKISTQMKHNGLMTAVERYEGQWDNMAKQYLEWRRERLDIITSEAAERNGSSRERYSDYLLSPEWRALRAKVIKRAGNLCEGCLDSEVHEVHHMTYEHLYDEFAFELKALCSPCHDRLHADKRINGFDWIKP